MFHLKPVVIGRPSNAQSTILAPHYLQDPPSTLFLISTPTLFWFISPYLVTCWNIHSLMLLRCRLAPLSILANNELQDDYTFHKRNHFLPQSIYPWTGTGDQEQNSILYTGHRHLSIQHRVTHDWITRGDTLRLRWTDLR